MKDISKQLMLFESIRKTWHNNEWHFSVIDVVKVLTDSKDAGAYWRKLKQREPQIVTNCHALKLTASWMKQRY